MACLKYNQSVTASCRDAQPGISKIYLANFSEIDSYTLESDGVTLSAITMSGSTKFYPLALNKEVASLIDTPTINLPNGVAISKPKLSFKIQGLSTTSIMIYKELMQADVAAVIKTINGDMLS